VGALGPTALVRPWEQRGPLGAPPVQPREQLETPEGGGAAAKGRSVKQVRAQGGQGTGWGLGVVAVGATAVPAGGRRDDGGKGAVTGLEQSSKKSNASGGVGEGSSAKGKDASSKIT
jgi:hypothetical protein